MAARSAPRAVRSPLNEYPDSSYTALTAAAAAYTGVEPHELVVGAGADEVLDLVAKAYLGPGSAALVPIPTYPMYGVLTGQRGAQLIGVPRLAPEHASRSTCRLSSTGCPTSPWSGCAPQTTPPACPIRRPISRQSSPPRPRCRPAAGRGRRGVLRVRRHTLILAPRPFPEPARRAHRVEGLCPRRRPDWLRRSGLGRSSSDWSASGRRDRSRHFRRTSPRVPSRTRLCARERPVLGRSVRGWPGPARRGRPAGWPSICNFLLVRIGDQAAAEAAAEMLLHAGIVPRTFGPANPCAATCGSPCAAARSTSASSTSSAPCPRLTRSGP